MDKLLELLKGIEPDIDFEAEQHLIDNKMLDSFAILQIVNDMIETFDIEISAAEIIPENFNSMEAMWNMVQRLRDEE